MGTPAPVASSFCRGCKHSFLTIKFANERQPHCQTHKNSRTSPPRRVSPYRQTVSGLDKSDSYQQLCNAVRQHSRPAQNEFDHVKMPARQRPQAVALASTVAAAALLLQGAPALAFTVHQEPDNALSFPTWVIHISSVIEWGIAMALVWKYAEVTGEEPDQLTFPCTHTAKADQHCNFGGQHVCKVCV